MFCHRKLGGCSDLLVCADSLLCKMAWHVTMIYDVCTQPAPRRHSDPLTNQSSPTVSVSLNGDFGSVKSYTCDLLIG